MAIDPTNHTPTQTEVEALVTSNISEIQTLIGDMVLLVQEDTITGDVTITDGSHSQFNTKLKILNSRFNWFVQLNGYNRAVNLQSDLAEDCGNGVKECYILDRLSY